MGAAALAATGSEPGLTPTIDRMNATTLSACSVENWCGGIDVPGMPF